jgi:hypothetical protein
VSEQPPERQRDRNPRDPDAPVFPEHRAYLLRLWRNSADTPWRASLQSVSTGERHMFADLVSLMAFLLDHARMTADEGEDRET